jgi:two-component system phosphate regulon sensor histidine kinase PhoR
MEQKVQHRLLISVCFLILFGLLAVQGYLLRNTYRLNLANYHNGILSAVLKLESDPAIKAINEQYLTNLVDCSKYLDSGKFDETQFKTSLRQKDEQVSERSDSILKIHALNNALLKDVRQRSAYTSIVIKGASRSITPVQTAGPCLTITRPGKTGFSIISLGDNNGMTDRSGTKGELHITYSMAEELEVPTLPLVIVRQLALVGGLSLVLLIAVIVLFYRILSAAGRQRKIAELKTDLVNNITHELKTPLSSMAIAFKTLRRIDVEAPPQQKQLIAALERQHHKLTKTVERVLESAMEQKGPNSFAELNMTTLLDRYTDGLISETHPVSASIEPGSYIVKGTESVIESAIDNLLENAQKYSEPGSAIRILGKHESDRYRVDIIDSGKGIAKEFQKDLFQKFYRVPENNLHSVKGLGLGLYLSRQSIKSIGGDVLLTSSSPDGSVFTIFLSLS